MRAARMREGRRTPCSIFWSVEGAQPSRSARRSWLRSYTRRCCFSQRPKLRGSSATSRLRALVQPRHVAPRPASTASRDHLGMRQADCAMIRLSSVRQCTTVCARPCAMILHRRRHQRPKSIVGRIPVSSRPCETAEPVPPPNERDRGILDRWLNIYLTTSLARAALRDARELLLTRQRRLSRVWSLPYGPHSQLLTVLAVGKPDRPVCRLICSARRSCVSGPPRSRSQARYRARLRASGNATAIHLSRAPTNCERTRRPFRGHPKRSRLC